MQNLTRDIIPQDFKFLDDLGFEPEIMSSNQLFLSLVEVWFYQACGGFSDEVAKRIKEILSTQP